MKYRMHKRVETKPDGRKIYYYTFEPAQERERQTTRDWRGDSKHSLRVPGCRIPPHCAAAAREDDLQWLPAQTRDHIIPRDYAPHP